MAPYPDDAVQARCAAFNQMFRGNLSAVEAIWFERDDISDIGPAGAIHRGQWRAVHHHTDRFS